jgi:hypothetical protein
MGCMVENFLQRKGFNQVQRLVAMPIIPTGRLNGAGFKHEYQVYDAKESPDHLHWLHTVLSNAKAFVGGTFHGLDSKHLQSYLDEFCYRFNRRKFKVNGSAV